jgi:hypothetical protein
MYSSLQKDTLERMVSEMLESIIIQHNNNLFAFPIVLGFFLFFLKDTLLRLCVDYRDLNKLTVKDNLTAIYWPIPRNIKHLRGLLDLIWYYRRFVKGYDLLCKPLTNLPKKDAFKWFKVAIKVFNDLKRIIIKPLVLVLLNSSKLFIMETDASRLGIRTILM